MPAPPPPVLHVTSAEFAACGWKEAIGALPLQVCSSYMVPLFDASKAAEASGDGKRGLALQALGILCALHFEREGEHGLRSAGVLEGLAPALVESLHEFLPSVDNADLRARLADIVWSRKRTMHEVGRIACDAYLESVSALEVPAQWVQVYERLARGIGICRTLGLTERCQTFVDRVDTVVCDTGRNLIPFHHLLFDLRVGDPERHANASSAAADAARKERNFETAEALYGVAARWHARRGASVAARDSRIAAAETRAEQAELFAAAGQSGEAAFHFAGAVALNQAAGGRRSEAERLHKRALDEQRLYAARAVSYKGPPLDLTEGVEVVRNSIRGQPLPAALLRLALCVEPQDEARLRRAVEEQSVELPLQFLMSASAIDTSTGRTVADRSTSSPGSRAREAAVQQYMHQRAAFYREAIGATIGHAFALLQSEHLLSPAALLPFVTASTFVHATRRLAFAKGLAAGLRGDMVEAVSVLVPLVENAIRRQLARAGMVVVTMKDGVQDEVLLKSLLHSEKAKEVFGNDLLFELHGLLLEPWGNNLRNRVAHGQLTDGEFFAGHATYFIWLTLYLCILPQLPADEPAGATQAPGPESDEGAATAAVDDSAPAEESRP